MQRFDAGKLFVRITGLSNMAHGVPENQSVALPEGNVVDLKNNIDFVCEELEKLELISSLASANDLKKVIYDEPIKKLPGELGLPAAVQAQATQFSKEWYLWEPLSAARYRRFSSDLVTRFKDELSARVVVTISPRHAKLLNGGALFGDAVFNAFPSANDDIAEAASCLTFERSTACVMHLMRVLEVGLKALAQTVGVPQQNDWGSYLREIEKELTKRMKAAGARSEDEQFYSEASASFDHLKRAFRNPTMHVERSYSPERAEDIFNAVGSLLRHLATKISEASPQS